MLSFDILIYILLSLVVFLVFILVKRGGGGVNSKSENSLILQQLNNISQVLDRKLSESNQTLQSQLNQSAKIIEDVTVKLTTLEKTNQQVVSFSEQLNDLRKILTNQKQRGIHGEIALQLILENMLPPDQFSLQYKFEDADQVDAVIFTKDGIIPVDAKFSLDNYERLVKEDDKNRKIELEKEFKNDIKKRIDETAKYIKPKEGTLEFAFMFIPTEAIYYDLLVNEVGAVKVNTRNLIDYAFNDKKVIIVSPTTFAAYLSTVLYGLRALKIEESAKSIRKNVEALRKHLLGYEDFMKKIGTSLGVTVSHYNSASKEFSKIDKDIVKIAGGQVSVEPQLLDKPTTEE